MNNSKPRFSPWGGPLHHLAKDRGLKGTLLIVFVPFLLASFAILAIWAGFAPLFGVRTAGAVSLLLFAFFASSGVFLAVKVTQRLIDPLTELSVEVNRLAARAARKHRHMLDPRPQLVCPLNRSNEIVALRHAVSNLKTEMEYADEVAKWVEHERARSVYSAKMASLGEMATGIAHEINNPLAILHGYGDQLEEMAAEGKIDFKWLEDRAKKIKATSMRVSKIIRGLLGFARAADSEDLSIAPVPEILADALELCQQSFKGKCVEFRKGEYSPLLTLECRPTQITQVLLNLLNNARDAAEESEERWVQLDVTELADWVRISVTDSGKGIPLEIREKIMSPFFTTKAVGKGTGLGLSITKSIVDSHRGTLVLDENSVATRFVIELPKRQPQEAHESSPKQHIFLVEDEKELSDIISEKLNSQGYRVFTATKANEAIGILNQQKFRCIILDIQLEQGSGEQVVSAIRKNVRSLNHKTPIIIISAHLNQNLIQKMAKDITCALVKPFERSELCAKVREICKAS